MFLSILGNVSSVLFGLLFILGLLAKLSARSPEERRNASACFWIGLAPFVIATIIHYVMFLLG